MKRMLRGLGRFSGRVAVDVTVILAIFAAVAFSATLTLKDGLNNLYTYQVTVAGLNVISNTAICDSTDGTVCAKVAGGGLSVGGQSPVGIAITGNPLLDGCRAQTAEQTAVLDGRQAIGACDVLGRRIIAPYANKELFVQGKGTQTSTTATTIIAAQGAGVKIYVTSIQCGNSGASASTIALNDTSGFTMMNPAGGGFTTTLPVPLVVAANTALQFTPSSASTTQICNAQGYAGS
jgi:hypothetical protein